MRGGGLLNRTLKILLIPIFALSLVSCGSSSDDESPKTPPTVNPTPTPNQPPKANAGEDKSAIEGTSITLQSASSDSDGQIVSYEWKEADSILSTKKSFSKVFSVGIHTITLKVTDNDGASDSDTLKVTITKKPTQTPDPTPNKAPKANAGEDINVSQGTLVTLDASSSRDSDGYITSYQWFKNGSLLSSQKQFSQLFDVGEHNISLKVTDDDGASDSDIVKVTINNMQDLTPPSVIKTIPNDKNASVHVDTNITIKFSENIKSPQESDIDFEDNESQAIAYDLSYDNTTFTLTLNPNANLKYDTNYTITLKDSILDLANNALIQTMFGFKTKKAEVTPPVSSSLLTKTWQKECFNYDTHVKVDCNETYKGQDGYYQKGINPNFTRDNDTNIVIDNNTNLQWQDDENVTKTMTWSEANTTCENLTLGGYTDWRVPNIDELETIVDYGRYKGDDKGSIGAINEVFKNINDTGWQEYWSSTTALSNTNDAWRVPFNYGTDYWDHKSNHYSVRCVREY